MSFRPFSYFAFGARRKYSREDFVFIGLIMMIIVAVGLFTWEGFILYAEFFQKKTPATVSLKPVVLTSELDEVLRTVDRQKNEFDDILELK